MGSAPRPRRAQHPPPWREVARAGAKSALGPGPQDPHAGRTPTRRRRGPPLRKPARSTAGPHSGGCPGAEMRARPPLPSLASPLGGAHAGPTHRGTRKSSEAGRRGRISVARGRRLGAKPRLERAGARGERTRQHSSVVRGFPWPTSHARYLGSGAPGAARRGAETWPGAEEAERCHDEPGGEEAAAAGASRGWRLPGGRVPGRKGRAVRGAGWRLGRAFVTSGSSRAARLAPLGGGEGPGSLFFRVRSLLASAPPP